MESTDRELLIEINGRLLRMETRLGNLESRVGVIENDIAILKHDISWLTYIIAGSIALLTFFIAFVSRPTQATPAKNESTEAMKYMLDILKLTNSRMNKENPPE